jgi:hypothetical protein
VVKGWSRHRYSGKSCSVLSLLPFADANLRQVFTAILSSYTDTVKGNQVVFLIGSAFAVLGALNAWFVVQDGEKHLEKEDQIWKNYLEENGWDASWGDHQTQDPVGTLKDELKPTS